MKRLVWLCILALTMGLTGCAEAPEAPAEFSAVFRVCREDTDCRGTVSVTQDGISVVMSAPHTAEGLRFDYTADGLSIGYGSHLAAANDDYLPADAIPSALHNTLAYLPQARYLKTENGAELYALPTPVREATLTVRDGIPISLSDPVTNLEFAFRDA